MTEQRQWPLIRGKARIWPNGQLQCHFCLGLFISHDRRRCYCSRRCRDAMHNAARREQSLDSQRCPVCSRSFQPRTHNQRWCSPQCRKLAWYRPRHRLPVDPLKGIDITNRLQKFPPDEEAHREWKRAQRLSKKRGDKEEPSPLEPLHRQVEVIDPAELLPEHLMKRIRETFANQMPSPRD